jgi:hypothetical protein
MASPAPISDAQLIANRENAQRSTGPRTAEGKSRTRLNGLRHGLTGQTVLLPEEDRAIYDKHCSDFLTELRPEGPVETQVAQSIADDYWRLNRIKAIEDNIFALGIEADPENEPALAQAQTFLDNAAQINLLSLYESRLNRAVAKKLAELRELQRLRKVGENRSGLIPTVPPVQSCASGHGFGFSTNIKPLPATGNSTQPDRIQPAPTQFNATQPLSTDSPSRDCKTAVRNAA